MLLHNDCEDLMGLKVLLVEDDPTDIQCVERAFRQGRIANELLVAKHGRAAQHMLLDTNNRTELVLLDLRMPLMNGLEFLQWLRAQPVPLRRLPVVVLTTSDEERDVVTSWDLGVCGYIVKPLTFDRFCEVLTAINGYWVLNVLPPRE